MLTGRQAALEQAYRNTLLVGRFPACVLYVELSCAAVDVNVHPAKTEVKFSHERAVFDAVKRLKEKDLIMEAEPCAEARRIGSKCYKVAVEPLQAIGVMSADHEGFSYEDPSPHEDASGAASPVHEDASPSRVGGHEDPSLPSMKEVHPIPKSKNKHFE